MGGHLMAGQGKDEAPGPLGLSGDAYWRKPRHQRAVLDFGSALVEKDVEGTFIDIPSKVHLDGRGSIPLVAVRGGSTRELFLRPLAAVGQLVVAHLESGALQAVKAGEPPPRDPDFEEPSPGWSMEDLEADLAEAVNLGPRLGRYAAYVLCGAEASNLREFSLFPSAGAETDPETAERIRQLREAGGPLLPLLHRGSADLVHEPEPTPPGSEPLWRLAHIPATGGRSRLHLEYRLEGLPRFVYPGERPRLDETGRRVYANLPILLLGFDGTRALVLRKALGLPVVTAPSGVPERPVLQGHVSLDLEMLLSQAMPGRLTLWALTLDRRAMIDLGSGAVPG
jgi:hypothetical protein